MCGINGFNFRDEERVVRMNRAIRHRGPDDTGHVLTKEWSLGANRLAIIDLSHAGHQPMRTEDGRYTIVMNGEVYNFEEVRTELIARGESFVSKSDTEVVLKAFRAWGISCLEKLNGMFAFALHDAATEEVYLVRDRLGIKPLYYYDDGKRFLFSSEIKALLVHDVPRELDRDALNIYFRTLYVPSPKTVFKGICKVPPGHYVRVAGDVREVVEYWSIPDAPLLTDKAEIRAELSRLMHDAVRLQMISDRPIGVFLSGGIDSTIVTGIMRKFSPHVRSFSVGFESAHESEKYNNDARVARQTAAHFGTDHREYMLSARDVEKNLVRSIYHMDEPISNHVQAVNLLLAEAVRSEATVVLGGDGGDELFGGYERYYYSRLIDRLRYIPGLSLVHPMFATEPGVDRYLSFFAQKEKTVSEFLRSDWNESSVTRSYFNDRFFSKPVKDFTRQFMRADSASWLPDESLMRSDKMSMAASVEGRVPFLDHRLVEFADRIPVSYKIGAKGVRAFSIGRGYKGKVILKEALSEYLPQFVLDQPKWGWFSPASKWLRGDLNALAREVLSPSYEPETAKIIDFQAVERVLEDHVSGKRYGLTTLWSVLTFQIWYRQFMHTP